MSTPFNVRSNAGPRGFGEIRKLKAGWKVIFQDYKNEGLELTFDKDQVDGPIMAGKLMAFSANKEGDKLFGVRPADGTHFVKFSRFTSRKGMPPAPRNVDLRSGVARKTGNHYSIPAHQEFTSILEIVGSAAHKGMEMPYNLWYVFERYEETNSAQFGGTNKARARDLVEFLELCGFDPQSESINYPGDGNVLPGLEAILQGKKRFLTVVLNGQGWIDSIASAPEGYKP